MFSESRNDWHRSLHSHIFISSTAGAPLLQRSAITTQESVILPQGSTIKPQKLSHAKLQPEWRLEYITLFIEDNFQRGRGPDQGHGHFPRPWPFIPILSVEMDISFRQFLIQVLYYGNTIDNSDATSHCRRNTHFRQICFSVPYFNFKYIYKKVK